MSFYLLLHIAGISFIAYSYRDEHLCRRSLRLRAYYTQTVKNKTCNTFISHFVYN